MRLSRERVLLLLLASTISCQDSTATAPPRVVVSRLYLLAGISGQPLPTAWNPGAGDTSTVLWGTLALDTLGNALTVEHVRNIYLAYPPEETTYSAEFKYRITGDSISVGSFGSCPPAAQCAGNRIGMISDSSLTLTFGNPTAPVYQYHLQQSF